MKQNYIYYKIRNEIISGVWGNGDKLPTEIEYSEKFSVARNTLRCAFKMLEDEGFIERVKSKGTFVRLPKVNPEEKNISLLVPCYEYLYCSPINFMNLMFELIAEAAKVGWRVTPVIFSKTNDPKDIWYENMAHFNPNSRIVINRKWFANYFPNLAGIGASVAFVNNDSNNEDEYSQYTSQWMNFIEEDKTAARKAVNYLRAQGCRKIALVMPFQDVAENSLKSEFCQYSAKFGLDVVLLNINGGNNVELLKNFYKQEKFDGLIIHSNEMDWSRQNSFRSWFGLSSDFPVVAVPMRIENIYAAENIPIIEYRIKEMAKDIVDKLISGQCIPCRKSYAPRLMLNGVELDF